MNGTAERYIEMLNEIDKHREQQGTLNIEEMKKLMELRKDNNESEKGRIEENYSEKGHPERTTEQH